MNLRAFWREVHPDVPRCVDNLLSNYASPWLVLPLSLYSMCVFASISRILHNWPRHCFISQSLTSCIYKYAACNRSGYTFGEFYRSPEAAHAYSQAAWMWAWWCQHTIRQVWRIAGEFELLFCIIRHYFRNITTFASLNHRNFPALDGDCFVDVQVQKGMSDRVW